MPGPTFSQRSWLSLVLDADPEFQTDKVQKTPAYKFTGGKVFRERPSYAWSTATT